MTKNDKLNTVAFLDSLAGCAPATLADHVLINLKPTILGNYRSIIASCTRRLKIGGTHHHLLGTVIFGSKNAGGPAPAWVGGIALMDDLVAKPDWMASTQVVTVINHMNDLGILTQENKSFLEKIAKGSKAVMTAGFALFQQLSERAAEEAILKIAAENERDVLMAHMKAMIQAEVKAAIQQQLISA